MSEKTLDEAIGESMSVGYFSKTAERIEEYIKGKEKAGDCAREFYVLQIDFLFLALSRVRGGVISRMTAKTRQKFLSRPTSGLDS